ncbi:pyrroline-5-carboxylate reductase [Clostridium grantii]|uniref:Pyrroline-5-carboxylate reductase n=1 Tax=Clostridium grantii DSM 8605 TaxID=1121316 RepID=A0A1M5XGL8_9CLOT|nr:pyrroline-5-carboxylate reductase [Clostridium grantii]SHH98792.1 pyrroline-5-carboxylate reductase [Clostridium grantii DSM 8605]
MSKKIGFIGCGNMAKAIIKGVLNSNIFLGEDIIVSDINLEMLEKTKLEMGIEITLDNKVVSKNADYIVLSIKPNMYEKIIQEIKEDIKEKTIVITIAAGITREKAESNFGKKVKLVRVMPNTPALVGEGMSALCPNDMISKEELKEVEDIFNSFGKTEIMEEKYMNAVTALTGSSPAIVYSFIEALADAAVLKGLPRDKAYKLASQAVLGSAKMVLETGRHPGELKDAVCSPGGTTIEAMFSLEKNGFRGVVMESFVKCVDKADEMSK